jgi:hypothetical protein
VFTRRLADHDCGIIAGDLLDELIPMRDAREFGLVPDDGVMDRSPVRGRWDRRVRNRCIGDRRLRRLLVRRPPRFCLFGHVHEGFEVVGNLVNGSWPKGRKLVSLDLDAGKVSFIN